MHKNSFVVCRAAEGLCEAVFHAPRRRLCLLLLPVIWGRAAGRRAPSASSAAQHARYRPRLQDVARGLSQEAEAHRPPGSRDRAAPV